ncbi:MAG: M15 family metallopeptidase [Oscillospiraceae bacterium]
MAQQKKRRKKKISRQALILRWILIIILVLLVWLAVRKIASAFKKVDDSADVTTISSESISQTEGASDDMSINIDGESGGIIIGTGDEMEETTASQQEDIDNAWAMFLVNNNNPLPEDYDKRITVKKVYSNGDRDFEFDERAADYLINMFAAAKKDGINLTVNSSYRTIEYQQFNFDRSVQQRVNNGMSYEEAVLDTEKEVAYPGKSEHNAGLSADIFSDEYVSFDDDGFKNTKAYAWLMENAADYGFILRYPEGKEDETGIIYEPWHYRFVGVYYAHKVKESGLCLEEYFEENGWLDENGTAVKMKAE